MSNHINEWDFYQSSAGGTTGTVVVTGAIAGNRLIGIVGTNVGQPVDGANPPGYDFVGEGADDGGLGGLALYERVATGDANDNMTPTHDASRGQYQVLEFEDVGDFKELVFANHIGKPAPTGDTGISSANYLILTALVQDKAGSWGNGSAHDITEDAEYTFAMDSQPNSGSNKRPALYSSWYNSSGNASENNTFTTGDVAGVAHSVIAMWDAGGAPLAPTIDTQPLPQVVTAPAAAAFSIVATTSGGTLHYQWKDDGANVGTDSAAYNTGATTTAQDGSLITCEVSDDNGTTISNAVLLTVNPDPIAFTPSIPDQTGDEEIAFVGYDSSSNFSGSETPFTYSLSPDSGALPSGMSIDPVDGKPVGTPALASAGVYTNIIVRGAES